MTTAGLGQSLGIELGSFLGRQIVLGACREDPDDFERRPMPAWNAGRLPESVDLTPWTTRVEDQGALGSCTANALAGAVEYLVRRARGDAPDVSRLFVYYHQRLWDGSVREDVGASIADGIRVLRTLGVPPESAWPYERELFAVQPPESVYALAERQQIADWWSIEVDADALKGCLARGFPVVFGTRVTESFMRPRSDGVIPMPGAGDRDDAKHGRHALLLVGYDDDARAFLVRNSWGEDWGARGHCWMPYAYVANRSWTRSCWAIRATEATELEPVHARFDPRWRVAGGAAARAGGGAQIAGTVAGMGASVAIGALTGSRFLAGLAGGLIAGVTPGVSHALRGRDAGAIVDRDKSEWILARMRGAGPAPGYARGDDWGGTGSGSGSGSGAATGSATASETGTGTGAGTGTGTGAEPGTGVRVVAVSPALARAHESAGGERGPLGPATHSSIDVRDAGWSGSALRCAHGAIVIWDTPAIGVLVLLDRDPCFAAWLRSGASRSPVSWPAGPVENVPAALVRVMPCVRGAIVEHAVHGAHPVSGPIFACWMQQGGAEGPLGPPIADAIVPADPREPTTQRFASGTVAWSPARGAWHEVAG